MPPSRRRTSPPSPPPGGEVWVAAHGGLARYSEAGGPAGGCAGARRRSRTPASLTPLSSASPSTATGRRLGRHRRRRGDDRLCDTAHRPLRALPRLHRGQRPLMHQILDAAYVDSGGGSGSAAPGVVNVYRPATRGRRTATKGGSGSPALTASAPPAASRTTRCTPCWGDRRGGFWLRHRRRALAALTPDPTDFGLGAFEQSRWMTLTRPAVPLAADAVHAIAEDSRGRPLLRHQERDLGAGRIPSGPRPALAPAPIQFSGRDIRGAAAPLGAGPRGGPRRAPLGGHQGWAGGDRAGPAGGRVAEHQGASPGALGGAPAGPRCGKGTSSRTT